MAVVGQQLLAPESGWKRYHGNISLIRYEGNWSNRDTVASVYGGYVNYNVTNEGKIEILFFGTRFRIIAGSTNSQSPNISISIDGLKESYSAYQSGTVVTYQKLVYEKTGLEKKMHRIVIQNEVVNTHWQVNAIDIDEDGELIRHDYFENTHLDEPTRKYGVAWFGFDEASGNVYDKLGSNYVGTVTGATRVQGWNGEGNALNTSSKGTYMTSNASLPNDEFSLRFKLNLKTNDRNYRRCMSSAIGTIAWYGIFIDYNITNTLNFYYYNNGTGLGPILVDVDNIYDEWVDFLYTFNRGAFELYLNESLVGKTTIGLKSLYHSSGLNICYPDNANVVAGQFDDVQIYSKALTPSDFTQHRVAIKTADNKNLVLPNREGRVKELPTADEVDLINQGYTWREIDNAVDATGINLTETTTEYEVVSKTNAALGAGKLFTIPLPTGFKTISVENNY